MSEFFVVQGRDLHWYAIRWFAANEYWVIYQMKFDGTNESMYADED